MAAAMALGNEMEKKRKAAQMSAAAVSFFLDRDGHKKFLRVATNQELEAENTALKATVQVLKERDDYYYSEMRKAERGLAYMETRCGQLESELATVERHRGHIKKIFKETFDKYRKAQEEKRELEERIQRAVTKALHPDWPNSEEEADNSPSPSFGDTPELHDESDPAYQGGNDGNPEGFL